MQPSEEIKNKLDIVDVIREYIPLKAAGINFRANCPFHQEKTPSFMVSPEKQIWHCFGCAKGGDVISFVQEIENLSFVEALRALAPRAGVVLERIDPKVISQRNKLLDILEASAHFYNDKLANSPQAVWAREYLKKRGLSEKTIDEWLIGYSPESWDDLLIYLKGRGFRDEDIFAAGMSARKESTNRYFNRFRDRIMFPISDHGGAVIAFSARVNPAKEATEQMGKYVNSPQTLVYDKSKTLFGLPKAKVTIKAADLAILVEGQMDVITAHQGGFKNVIASSGTALTKDQLIMIKRLTNNISLAFDMDKAGQNAAIRGINEAMSMEMNIKVIIMPEGLDPDECVRTRKDDWEKAVKEAKPMMEYYFDKIFESLDMGKIEDKRNGAKEALVVLARLENKIEKDHWLKKLSNIINVEENILRETLNKAVVGERKEFNNNRQTQPAEVKSKANISRGELLSELLSALLVKHSDFLSYYLNHLAIDYVQGDDNKEFYKNLFLYYNESKNTIPEDFYQEFKNWLIKSNASSNQLKLLDRLVILADRDYYELDKEMARGELDKIVISLKKIYLSERMKEIERLIEQSEKENDQVKANELLKELSLLTEEYKEI